MAFILFFILMRKVDLLPPSLKALQFGRFLKNGNCINKTGFVVNYTFIEYLPTKYFKDVPL